MSHDNPLPQDPPTGTPPAKAQKGAGRGRSGWTAVLAGLALLLAAVAVVLSWHANSVAGDAAARADKLAARAAPPSGPAVTVPPPDPVQSTTAPVDPGQPSESAEGSPPPLGPETQFDQFYIETALEIPGPCNGAVYIDLDKPRVQVDPAIAELSYHNPCTAGNTPYLTLQPGVEGTSYDSEAVKPSDCVTRIAVRPLAKEGRLPAVQGDVYCLLTSDSDAQRIGIPRKMVVVSVTGLGKADALALQATAWNIPR
ncbi:hypothetical protein [Actinoplanes teichomyceticus]|uniref:Uncharacterized protein n=1 Tax=Actinoplanes teichomyceticus TaxID=1867 RepID=A0A561WJJ2_ACTTI|nr:hypothetical protein [Actinoplanes teichomyceticus]TWG24041.1 hypothetical protein FHX34_102594 [Actinoplanes teichomyceticus]GIF12082.1 hypothetical protein Ate01nite_21140 [Actinoplanes teichomyceticus]